MRSLWALHHVVKALPFMLGLTMPSWSVQCPVLDDLVPLVLNNSVIGIVCSSCL